MTGYPTDDTSRADNPPRMDHDSADSDNLHRNSVGRDRADTISTGATGATGADAEADASGDAALDAMLSGANGSILMALQGALDLDAGLTALYTGSPHGRKSGSSAGTRTAAGSPGEAVSGPFPRAGNDELDAVCELIGGYLFDLEPLVDPAGGVPATTAMSFAAVYRLLDELRAGLLDRSLDRDSADRLARLSVHNATETRQLLVEERHRTIRPGRRGRIDAWTATVSRIRDALGELRPRIRLLFDDAEDTAPRHPAPRLPV